MGDSSRRAIVLRDSLMREARRDTSMAGRVHLDSLRRAFFRPDTTGLSGTAAVIPYTADAGMISLTSVTPTCGTSIDTYVVD